MINYLRFLLTTPDANSRFIYLLQGAAVAFSIVILSVAYVLTHDPSARDGYGTMMGTLLGGGALSSLAKGYSKKAATDNVGDASTTSPTK